jgi:hypothetical protein
MTLNEDIESQPLLVTEPPGQKQGQWAATPLLATLLFSAAVILAALSFFALHHCPSHNPEIQHFLGAYAPYFPAKPYIPPPSYCQITQVRSFFILFIFFSSLISNRSIS